MPNPPPLPRHPQIPIPKGFECFGDVKVAGTHTEGRPDILRKLANPASGESWQLIPEREPSNPYDENAVAIIAVSGRKRLHLGYLPKQVAASLSTCKRLAIVPRSIDINGSYLYIDLFHSPIRKKQGKAAGGCRRALFLIAVAFIIFFLMIIGMGM